MSVAATDGVALTSPRSAAPPSSSSAPSTTLHTLLTAIRNVTLPQPHLPESDAGFTSPPGGVTSEEAAAAVSSGSGGSGGSEGDLVSTARSVLSRVLSTAEPVVVRYKDLGDPTGIGNLVEAVGLGAGTSGLSVLSLHQDTTGAGPWLNNTTSYLPDVITSGLSNVTASTSAPVVASGIDNVVEIVIIAFVVTILSVLTAGGNLMVLISFRMDKQLQTVSNYFLLSLAVADFFIGIVSMPLYTVYLLMNRWPLGPIICDTWLSIDYTMSNASVANLLLISFDRYLSVTRPLTYRAKRTPKRAAIMISLAWVISAIMWTPWIFAWPYIEGVRSVEENECYIQFLATNQYLTVITAVAAFYLPVLIMCVLYFKIYLETEKRQKGLAKLQATKQISKYGDSSDDDVCTSLSHKRSDSSPDLEEAEIFARELPASRHRPRRTCWQRACSCCRIDPETLEYADDSSSSDPPGSPVYECTPSASQQVIAIRRDHSLHEKLQNGKHNNRRNSGSGLMIPLIAVDSNRSTPTATPSTDITTTMSRHSQLSSATAMTLQSADSEPGVIGGPSSGGQPEVGSVNTPDSSTAVVPPYRPSTGNPPHPHPHSHPYPNHPGARRTSSQERQHRKDRSDMYTILIKLPDEGAGEGAKPTIKMITDSETDDDDPRYASSREAETIPMTERRRRSSNQDNSNPRQDGHAVAPTTPTSSLGRRLSNQADLRMAMQARVAAKLVNKAKSQRARKKRQERKEENKAAKTLSAILLAFIVTWTPYNIFTVIKTFCQNDCINTTVYAIGYWLCYINSTINPICYALCNANFRRTYWRILTCRFGRKKTVQQKRSGIYETSTSGVGKSHVFNKNR